MNRTRTPRPNLLHQVERDRRQVLRNVRCARWFVKDARTPPPPYRAAALETVQSSNSADHETRHAQSAVPHATPVAVVALVLGLTGATSCAFERNVGGRADHFLNVMPDLIRHPCVKADGPRVKPGVTDGDGHRVKPGVTKGRVKPGVTAERCATA